MCGLIGVCGDVTVTHEKAIGTLLVLDSLRGTDSTGIAVVPSNGDVKMAKAVGHPFNLFDTKQYDKSLMGAHRAIIGHNRYATQGKVNARNAHPFEFNTVVGAHNGTLNGKYRLEDANQYDVDSENLYHHIDKKGIKDALNVLDGAWALTWWDKVKEEMCFLRNKERPLFLTRTKDNKAIFWASEKWMLEVALSRHTIEHQDIVSLDVDTLVTIGISPGGIMEKLVATPAASKYEPPVHNNYHGGTWQHGKWVPSSPTTGCTGPAGSGSSKVYPFPSASPEKTAKEVSSKLAREVLKLPHSAFYANTKDVLLSVDARSKDFKGATYYDCTDKNHPEKIIRLYYTTKRDNNLLGREIRADIGGMHVDRVGSFYKVISSSVTSIVDAKEQQQYRNYKGAMVSYDDWQQLHGECVYCSSAIDPSESGYGLTPNGEALCKVCMEDHELRNYVSIVN